MIYSYLLCNAYKLAKRVKNDDDDAIWWGGMIVGSCLIFNIGTIICLLDGIGLVTYNGFDNKYRYIAGAIIAASVGGYYLYKGRYKKIISRCEAKGENQKNVHPVLVVLSYCIVSIALLVLSAMYKNGDLF